MISTIVKRKCLTDLGMMIKMDAVGTYAEFVEDEDGIAYDLTGMTDSEALDMLRRSNEEGRNLFFVERPIIEPEHDEETLV